VELPSDIKPPILPDSRLLSFYFDYNFIKIHRTLRSSPAMAAGVTDRLWGGFGSSLGSL